MIIYTVTHGYSYLFSVSKNLICPNLCFLRLWHGSIIQQLKAPIQPVNLSFLSEEKQKQNCKLIDKGYE